MLVVAVLCSLSVWTWTVDAMTVPILNAVEPPSLDSEVPGQAPNITMHVPTQNDTNGPQVSTLAPMNSTIQGATEVPSLDTEVPGQAPNITMHVPTQNDTNGPQVSTLAPMNSTIQGATEVPSLDTEVPVQAPNVTTKAPKVPFSGPASKAIQVPSGLSNWNGIPLSLSLNSVDDMYYGCSQKMLVKVKRHYLPKSRKAEGLYSKYTELCVSKNVKIKDAYDPLTKDHFRAICAYTASAYADFNRASRKGKATYRTSFEFHALHFLLSDAVRLLKLNQRSCTTAYRRTRLDFSGEVGQTMRFGSFASSSLNKDLAQFGTKTCFKIHTCFGAYLKSYSEFGSDEDEVLIPPYEMFNIVAVYGSGENDLGCDVLYELESAGVHSALNCQALRI